MLKVAVCCSILFAATTVYAADGPRADRLSPQFNKASERIGSQMRASQPKCSKDECEYSLAPRGRLSVSFSGSGRKVDEVAGYFEPDATGAHDAILTLSALIEVFASDQPVALRAAAREQVLSQAAGPTRRGEVRLGAWRYVAVANDGRDVRLYVSGRN